MIEDDDVLVIHNEEQVQIIAVLESLRDAFAVAKNEAFVDSEYNESLHKACKGVVWSEVECTRAERWLDQTGDLGWRCYVGGGDKDNPKLLAVIRDKIASMGWEGIEVVPA